MFGILKTADIKPAEFALIVGVKRVAVYNWLAGRSKPHALIAPRVTRTLELLKKMVDADKLPLREGLDKETRTAKIRKLKEVVEAYSA